MTLYADDDLESTRIVVPPLTGFVIAVGVAATLVFGVWPGRSPPWPSTRRSCSVREAGLRRHLLGPRRRP